MFGGFLNVNIPSFSIFKNYKVDLIEYSIVFPRISV